jgi:hypothetical protein
MSNGSWQMRTRKVLRADCRVKATFYRVLPGEVLAERMPVALAQQ